VVLSSTHITFPPDRWPKLLPMAELTLNHLPKWHPKPSLSAWHGLRGFPHDFAAKPIHPPGQLVVIHDSPLKRASWARHGVRGFYLGPALSHYRSHNCFLPKTGATRISDSLAHFPDPLFPFEDIVPDAEPLPDPTSSRSHPAFDGLDLVGQSFVDPDLGVCTVVSGAPPLFLQPLTGNLATGPRLSPGWHPTLRYRTIGGDVETFTVTEVARWIRDQPTPAPAPVIAHLFPPEPTPPQPRASRRRAVTPRPVVAPVVPTPRRSSRVAAMSCAPLPFSPSPLSQSVPLPVFSEPHIFRTASSCFSGV
jgi:hypothetical protein